MKFFALALTALSAVSSALPLSATSNDSDASRRQPSSKKDMKDFEGKGLLEANSSYVFSSISEFLNPALHTTSTLYVSFPSSHLHYKNNVISHSPSSYENVSSLYHDGTKMRTSTMDSITSSSFKDSKSDSLYTSRNQHISFSLDKTFTRSLKTTSLPPFPTGNSLESIKIPKFISSIFVVPSRDANSTNPIVLEQNPGKESNNLSVQDIASGTSTSNGTFSPHLSPNSGNFHKQSHYTAENAVDNTNVAAKGNLKVNSVKPNEQWSSKFASQTSKPTNSSEQSTYTKTQRRNPFPTRTASKSSGKVSRNSYSSKSSHSYKAHQHLPPQVLSFLSGSVHSFHSARRRSFVPAPSTTSPGAFFDPSSPSNVSAQLGSSAYLPCKIRNLGNKTVSWIRNRDSHILTVDRYTFIADERFQAWHEENSDTWTLMVKYVQERDDGRYECQVSTEPKMSHFVYFHVVSPNVKIPGGSDIYVKVGSNVSLKCVISAALKQPDYIFWYKGNERVITYGHGAPRIFLDRIANDSSVGTLLIPHAMPKDAGMYRCVPEKLTTANVTLHVINGEHPAAMQHGTSVMTRPGSPDLLVTSLVLVILVQETTRSVLPPV